MIDERPSARAALRSALREVSWPFVPVLAAVGLLNPALGVRPWLELPVPPPVVTAAISVAWITAVGFSSLRRPVLTLVCAAVACGVVTTQVSSVLPAISLLFAEDGWWWLSLPLAELVAVGCVNAVWGGACGVLALGVRRLRSAPDDGGPSGAGTVGVPS